MKLSLRKGNNILGGIGVLMGLVILALAFVQKLPYMKNNIPGPGFFPIVCGIGIAVFGALIIVENQSKAKKAKESNTKDKDSEENIINKAELRNFAYIIGSSILVLILTPLIGMLISIGAVVTLLVKILAEESLIKSIIIGAGTTIVLFLIFRLFLGVPLPNSFIGL
ncbi:MAG: hypothetical protein K0R09_3393 [Clostridiales bacterium]|jgi:hypothetical protein|nr:hypothetical protein [Clostridiales bacterium]